MSEDNKMYQGLCDKFPMAKFVGLTATPFRFSGDDLPLGEVLFEMDIGTAIAHNYLVPLVPEVLKSNVSLANVKTQMGDFAIGELSKTINTEERNKLIIDRVEELIKSGRQGVVFGADVKHSQDLCKMARERNISCAEIYGTTPDDERDILVQQIRDRKIDCTFNNLTMTEGTDMPHWSFAVIARPTRSLGLYIQAVGRVARKCPEIGKKDSIIVDVYDKLKVKQSRITFNEMAYEGDMYGERRRANNILTADIEWDKKGSGAGTNDDSVAYLLKNFPVFMIHEDDERWTTDESYFPITSWMISPDQRLITWTEEKEVKRPTTGREWVPMKTKPTHSLIKQYPVIVKHEVFGIGKIIDIGYGMEVKVEFGANGWLSGKQEFVSIDQLLVGKQTAELTGEIEKYKTDRVFYVCFPPGIEQGRVVEFLKEKKDLRLVKDSRMTIRKASDYIVKAAKDNGVFPLVRSDAKWKKNLMSESQRRLIQSMVDNGKVRFDIDLDTMTKGDASAVIEQVKWQKIIQQKFGAKSKDKLLGYDVTVEDV